MTKMKVLGLGILAAMALSVVGVMNATAETGGHFTHDGASPHILVVGTETEPNHKLEFTTGSSQITCKNAAYHGTVNANTVESITIAPTWSNCYTTADPNTLFDVVENECHFVFTIGREGQAAKHHTAHVACPAGKSIEIKHPSCTIRVPSQTVTGVTYTTDVQVNKHAITLDSTVEGITSHYESGICVFLGTTHSSTMTGSVTVHGEETTGARVNITATTGPKL